MEVGHGRVRGCTTRYLRCRSWLRRRSVVKKVIEEEVKKRKEGSNPTARRRGANRAEAREEYELERVLSCCNGDRRRRAKLDFSSRKPLDELHRASTLGAAPKLGRVLGGGGVLFGLWLLWRAEKVKAKR